MYTKSEIMKKCDELIKKQTARKPYPYPYAYIELSKSRFEKFLFSPALSETEPLRWLENRKAVWEIICEEDVPKEIIDIINDKAENIPEEKLNELQKLIYYKIDASIYFHLYSTLKIKKKDFIKSLEINERKFDIYFNTDNVIDGKFSGEYLKNEQFLELKIQERIYNVLASYQRPSNIYEGGISLAVFYPVEAGYFCELFCELCSEFDPSEVSQNKIAETAQEKLEIILKEEAVAYEKMLADYEVYITTLNGYYYENSDGIIFGEVNEKLIKEKTEEKINEHYKITQKTVSRILSKDENIKFNDAHEKALLLALYEFCFDEKKCLRKEHFYTWVILSNMLGFWQDNFAFTNISVDAYGNQKISEIKEEFALPEFDINDSLQNYIYSYFDLLSGENKIFEKYKRLICDMKNLGVFSEIMEKLESSAFVKYKNDYQTNELYRKTALIQNAIADYTDASLYTEYERVIRIFSVVLRKEETGTAVLYYRGETLKNIYCNLNLKRDDLYMYLLIFLYNFNGGFVYELMPEGYEINYLERSRFTFEEKIKYNKLKEIRKI